MKTDVVLPADASVPVSIPEAYGGLAECHGSLRLLTEGLQLEFRGRDGLLGLFKGGIKEVTVPWAGVVDLKLRRVWFVTRLFLIVSSARYLENVPGATGSQVRLAIERKYVALARQLVFAVNLRLCEQQIQSAVPPRPTPPSSTGSAL